MRAVMQLVTLRRAAVVAVWCSLLARPSSAQQRDTTTPPRDSLKVYTLPPAVVSVTRLVAPEGVAEDVLVLAGTFDRHLDRNWTKWQSSTSFRVGRGGGSGLVTVSQLDYTGQRQHSDADLRNLNSRRHFPLAGGWSLTSTADVGWDPRADN